MTNGVFLEEIEFTDNFPPFEKGTKVKFGDEMKEVLEFYLRNKESWNKSDAKKVADRMKINVIVGENGTGKSRLLIGKINNTITKTIISKENLGEDEIYKKLSLSMGKTSGLGELNFNKEFLLVNINSVIDVCGSFENTLSLDIKNILKNFFRIEFTTKDNYKSVLNKVVIKNLLGLSLKNDLIIKENVYSLKYYKLASEILEKIDKDLLKNQTITDKLSVVLSKTGFSHSFFINSVKEFGSYFSNLVSLMDINQSFFYNFVASTDFFKDKYFNLLNSNESENFNVGLDISLSYLCPLLEYYNGKDKKKASYLRNLLDIKNFSEYKSILQETLENIKLGEIYKFEGKILLKDEINFLYDNFLLDCKFSKGETIYNFSGFSSGEKAIIARFVKIYTEVIKGIDSGKKNFLILIDEPDLHLHLDWQRQYIQKLIDVFAEFLKEEENKDISLHFIIATHSPFILSDVPAENVILLQKEKDNGGSYYTKVTDWWGNEFNDEEKYLEKKTGKGTFGANFVDLIRNGFFFDTKNLMGSFAEEVIDKIAQIEKDEIIKNKEVKDLSKIKKNIKEKIGDSFLKDNLLYFKKSKGND